MWGLPLYLWVSLLCLLLHQSRGASIPAPHDANDPCGSSYPYKMVNMSLEEMKKWYSPYDICVLANNNKVDACNQPHHRECTVTLGYQRLPSVLYQQPVHAQSGEPLPRPSMIGFLRDLERRGQTLVIIGDSISREFVHSLYCALRFENPQTTITPPVTKALFGVVEFVFTVPGPKTGLGAERESFRVVYFSVANRFGCSGLNWVAGEVNNTVLQHGRRPVVLFNSGLHERDNNAYAPQLECILRRFEEGLGLGAEGMRGLFAYRETSAQNYPSSPGGEIDFGMRKRWLSGDAPYPVCASYLCNATVAGGSRLDTELRLLRESQVRAQAAVAGARLPVHHIPYKHHSRRYWELHPASGFQSSGNVPNVHRSSGATDCTHSKYNPIQYQPAWNALMDIVLRA